jgi:hypothetical protein
MSIPGSVLDRELKKFVESPTRPNETAIEVTGTVGAPERTTLVDVVSSSLVYLGEAVPGSLDSEAKWLIKKIVISGGAISIKLANGSSSANQVWNDRGTLTYV